MKTFTCVYVINCSLWAWLLTTNLQCKPLSGGFFPSLPSHVVVSQPHPVCSQSFCHRDRITSWEPFWGRNADNQIAISLNYPHKRVRNRTTRWIKMQWPEPYYNGRERGEDAGNPPEKTQGHVHCGQQSFKQENWIPWSPHQQASFAFNIEFLNSIHGWTVQNSWISWNCV